MTRKTQNKLRKIAALVSCAVLLVCVTIGATVAYLTSTATVENTFTVGDVKITLDELDVDNSTPGAERDQSNEYHLLPGKTYTKDPKIHIDSKSEDCYLFVKVENGIADIEAESETTTIAAQMQAKGWKPLGNNIYVFTNRETGERKVVSYATTPNVGVFDNFTIDGKVNNETLNGNTEEEIPGYDNAEIRVTAFAVQTEGFEEYEDVYIWNEVFGTVNGLIPTP